MVETKRAESRDPKNHCLPLSPRSLQKNYELANLLRGDYVSISSICL